MAVAEISAAETACLQSLNGLDQQVWNGIQLLIDNFVQPASHDDIVIAYTPDSREPAAWVAMAFRERGFDPALVHMSPLRDPGFQDRIASVIPENRHAPGTCILLMFERDTMSHNVVVKRIFSKYDPLTYKVVRAINSGRDLFAYGLLLHPSDISALNTTLLLRCRDATSLHITTPGGSDLQVTLDNRKYMYKSSRGVWQPGKFMVIPPGEVATFPADISGALVADFAINVNMRLDQDVRLEKNPVTVNIDKGKLTSFTCQNEHITRFLNRCFERNNATYVGELGFGTNTAVVCPVAENSHLNERVPGIHLGFGQHNQTDEAAGYSCDVHVDLCAKGGSVWFDNSNEPIDLEKLTPSRTPHPPLISGEDVFSDDAEDDCCGILR